MKKTLLSLLFVSFFAHAEEVTVTGYGTDFNSALQNAKVAALEKGASTFMIGKNEARDGRVYENIDQYNGGVIKSYDVIDAQRTANGFNVTIVADVEPKNNQVRTTQEQFIEFDERYTVADRLSNVSDAIVAQAAKPTLNIGSGMTTVSVNVELSWQPKWLSDMRSFTSVINEDGRKHNNIHENVAGGLTNFALGAAGPIAGWLTWEATKPPPVQRSDSMMVCFNDGCKNLNVDINLPRNPKLVLAADNGMVLAEHFVNIELYKFASAGDVEYNRYVRSFKETYDQPALVVYENRKQVVRLKFNQPTNVLRNVKHVNVYLK